jgi:FkbM family methyltransferase
MLTKLKTFAPKQLNNFLRRAIYCYRWDPWQLSSWSQEGEDLVLARLFGDKKNGFYVDVGAHHPKRFSNTYFFYRRGWRGINIDAMPGSMGPFNRMRPRDINIEVGIGNQNANLEYHFFNEPALNGFVKQLAQSRHQADNPYKIIDTKPIEVRPLWQVLDEHLPVNQGLDFMNIDVEGLDLDVLRSSNWTRYRPRYVLAEILETSLSEIQKHEVAVFMSSVGYCIYAKCVHTAIFTSIDH